MGYYYAKALQRRPTPLKSSPTRRWATGGLPETSGTTAADSSGNALDGTYVNSPTLNQTGGPDWQCRRLVARASSQRVNLGTPSALNHHRPDHA